MICLVRVVLSAFPSEVILQAGVMQNNCRAAFKASRLRLRDNESGFDRLVTPSRICGEAYEGVTTLNQVFDRIRSDRARCLGGP